MRKNPHCGFRNYFLLFAVVTSFQNLRVLGFVAFTSQYMWSSPL
jgi:hypothetical protein